MVKKLKRRKVNTIKELGDLSQEERTEALLASGLTHAQVWGVGWRWRDTHAGRGWRVGVEGGGWRVVVEGRKLEVVVLCPPFYRVTF